MNNRTRLITAALLGLDTVFVWAVFQSVAYMRSLHPYAIPVLLIPLFFVVLSIYLVDGYRMRTDMLSLDYTSLHSIAIIVSMLGLLLLTFVFYREDITLQSSRAVLIFSFLSLIPITLVYRRWFKSLYIRKLGRREIIFIGDQKSCDSFKKEYVTKEMSQPLSLCVPNPGDATGSGCHKSIDELLRNAQEDSTKIEAFVMRETNNDLPAEASQVLLSLFFKGTPTYTLELFHQVYWRKIPLYRLNQTWLFQEGFQIAREPIFERIKRISDILLCTIATPIFLPFIVFGIIAVWVEDRGPVFFAQTRVGKNRKPFRLYKIRSMRTHTGGDPYTRSSDQRITKVGRLLRATRIDEFPQIWNVIKGDMSLIGPRAEWEKLVSIYEAQIPCYHFRHLVKPGITGWAQVNYPYGANIDDTLKKLEYDLYYIRHFSFRLDASITLKTLHVMLFGKGR